jgi:L-2-hydroxyglutarate oxidase LhgO
LEIECAVIGGGVVGLAVARALALQGREVVLLEAEAALGSHTSARNSEVIHAGIYYAPGSLKAALCVSGRRALYAYCDSRGVACRRTGKLIIATREEELPQLEQLRAQAQQNGVDDLVLMGSAEARALEPEVACVRALFSPSTGIIDSHGLMLSLRRELEQAGGAISLRAPVLSGSARDGGVELRVGGAEPCTLRCKLAVNAAGLWAPTVAASIEGTQPAQVPRPFFAKGHYFTLQGRAPFRHLVYPVPVPGGLGIHLTLDLAGAARFGPDVSWVAGVDYSFDEARAASFYPAIRRYWPGLPDGALQPGYTGIRPKLAPASGGNRDFLLQTAQEHGVKGLINLCGIESPGLTACLSLAERVCALAGC